MVKDVAGKSRVVGITNYWVQCSLQPLHKAILDFLKRVPMDGTYRQEEVIQKVISPGMKYSSFDLSSATDRLPMEVQRDILSLFIGEKRAHS